MTTTARYTFGTTLAQPVEQARPRGGGCPAGRGFRIFTEIDVAATLKAKLGLDHPPYLILGACNPTLAHAALEADPSIGALLPCNVVLREDQPGVTTIEVLDPVVALSLASVASIAPIARQARERLAQVVAALEG